MVVVRDASRTDLGGNLRHGDMGTFHPRLWRFLVERFSVKSVLDVGCGEGHAVAFFSSIGVHAHGIEGLLSNVKSAVFPIALHDILAGPYAMPVDLVWSCEVAEHILPGKVDNYIETLANGKIIAMTHALPDQTGHHHVNCQPSEYWIEKLKARGFHLDPNWQRYRDLAATETHPVYFRKSGLVFCRD